MDITSDFLLIVLPLIAIYLGALAVVRHDTSKIEKKVDSLQKEIMELKKVVQNKE